MKKHASCAATLLALMIVIRLAGQQQSDHRPGTDLVPPNIQENHWSELKASMEKMHVAMAPIESSGNSDVDFVKLMLPHHQAALDMAKTELMYGKDPQIRRLAQEIMTDQQSEIELMQLWLKQRETQK